MWERTFIIKRIPLAFQARFLYEAKQQDMQFIASVLYNSQCFNINMQFDALVIENNGREKKKEKRRIPRWEVSSERRGWWNRLDFRVITQVWRRARINWMQRVLTGRHIGRQTRRLQKERQRRRDWPIRVCIRCGRDIGFSSTVPPRPCTCHFRWPCHSAPSSSSSDLFLLTSHAVSSGTVDIEFILAATGPRDKNGYLHLSHLELLWQMGYLDSFSFFGFG